MIDDLKKKLIENKKFIPRLQNQVVSFGDLKLSTFYHGEAKGDSKVLFLVSYKGFICTVLKIIRDSQYDYKLKKEADNQELASNILRTFSVPKVYFRSNTADHSLIAEEYIQGEVLGRSGCHSIIKDIYQFQEELSQGSKIALKDVYSILVKSNREIGGKIISLLQSLDLSCEYLDIALSHGDMTYMNIIRTQQGLCFIDWDRFNERNIKGIDLCHYLIRCFSIETLDGFREIIPLISQKIGIDLDSTYFSNTYILDTIFDLLQKQHMAIYKKVIGELKTLQTI